ncbi:MAG: YncE family protein, partial [Bacteroidales bacterium]|nr:YncE family protein [Bacteroidales bacterium]
YSTSIRIFDPAGYTLTGSIETRHSTEQMVLWNDYVFVSCWSFGNTILKIDTQSDLVVDSLQVTNQPNSMVIDKNNRLWVLSDGGFEGSPMGEDFPALTQIDPETMKVLKVLPFPSKSGSPNNLVINENRDSLFFLHGSWTGQSGFSSGVYAMSVNQNTLPDGPLVPESHHLFYRLGIDPSQSVIYVSDALDYMQQGYVFRFTPQGSIIDSLKADRIPGFFAFQTTKK